MIAGGAAMLPQLAGSAVPAWLCQYLRGHRTSSGGLLLLCTVVRKFANNSRCIDFKANIFSICV